jgi:hypothetical protein
MNGLKLGAPTVIFVLQIISPRIVSPRRKTIVVKGPTKMIGVAALGLQLEEGDAVAAKCDLDGGGRGNGCRGWSCGHIRARINR